MPRLKENVGGGLRSGPDPADLEPSELSQIKNAVYKPASDALYRARGRFLFATATATTASVLGLRDLQFDNGNHYLVAMTPSAYSTSVVSGVGVSGHFYPWITGTAYPSGTATPTALEVIQYRNRFFLMNGAYPSNDSSGSNIVVYATATGTACTLSYRQHGMLAVKDVVKPTTAVGAFSQTVTGFYEYWTTEVARISADGAPMTLESAFEGKPETVSVPAITTVPMIYMPTTRNPGFTTHWRIYRSPMKGVETDVMFPVGFMIAELPATGVSAVSAQGDTGTASATTWLYPATYNASPSVGADFGNVTGISVSADGSYATAVVLAGETKRQGCYGFTFPAIAGQIGGIEVEVQAYATGGGAAAVPISVALGTRDSVSWPYSGWFRGKSVPKMNGYSDYWVSKVGIIQAQAASAIAASGTITLGGSTDKWWPSTYPGFNANDFNTNFMAMISVATPTIQLFIDSLRVKVHYGATQSGDSVIQFPTVIYNFGDIQAQVAKNSQPPASSTGDLYEDTLVVNDVTNPSHIKYSFPEEPESFPATYYIDFETRDNDIVRCIRTVNSRLLVGLDTSLWRVNYLPSERDSSFDRGKAIERISNDFGIVNPMCAATFSIDGGPEMLAFVSWKGIHMTDGFSVTTLTNDLDWRAILGVGSTTSAPICLINDPENMDLVFYYRNDDLLPESYQALHLSYAPKHIGLRGNAASHIAGGYLKASGPVNMRNWYTTSVGAVSASADVKSAWPVPIGNGNTKLYIGYGGDTANSSAASAGAVMVEGGSTIPAQDPHMSFITRRMFLAGEAGEVRLNELYMYGTFATALATASGMLPVHRLSPLTLKANDSAGEVTQGTYSFICSGQKLYKHQPRQTAGGFRLKHEVISGDDDSAVEFMVVDFTDFGLEDGGK